MRETIEFSADGDGAIKAAYSRDGKHMFAVGKIMVDSSPDEMKKAKFALARACISACGGDPL